MWNSVRRKTWETLSPLKFTRKMALGEGARFQVFRVYRLERDFSKLSCDCNLAAMECNLFPLPPIASAAAANK